MRLLEVHCRDFRSLGSVDMDFRRMPSGVALVSGQNLDAGGSNGSGKTSLFDAIFFCLTGCILVRGGLVHTLSRRSVSQYLRRGASSMEVRIVYEHRGEEHEVRRTFPPMALWFDGESVDDERLASLLPFSLRTLYAISPFYFPYGASSYLFSLTYGSRKVVDQLIHAGGGMIFLFFSAVASEMLYDVRRKLKECEDSIKTAYTRLDDKQKMVALATEAAERVTSDLKAAEAEFVQVDNRGRALKARLDELIRPNHQSMTLIQSQAQRWLTKGTNIEDFIREATRRLDSYESSRKKLKEALRTARAQKGVCPVCGGPLTPQHLGRYVRGLVQAVRSERAALYKGSVKESLKFIEMLKEESARSVERSEEHQEAYGIKAELLALRDRYRALEASLTKLRRDEARAVESLKEARQEYLKVEADKVKFENKAKELSHTIDQLTYWKKWGLSQAQRSVEEYCQILESSINHILEAMDMDLRVSLRAEFEKSDKKLEKMTPGSEAVKKIVVEFLRRGEVLTVDQLSNGEYQTINVVAALVMQSLTPCDFMLLDEPAIAIDYEHADRLYTLLQDTARREGRQFFIVDHGVLKDFPYDHKIEIVKENGVSTARWVEEQP